MLPGGKPTPGARKAIILSSANDYYRKDGEPDFNDGEDAKFNGTESNWEENQIQNGSGGQDNLPGHNGTPGLVHFVSNTWPNPNGYVN